ncbi:MAG: hypothetical protein K8R60_24340 [Burkholderiales bacterium]|nr:hypothetical protein [Burkholderiales bacterium]
MDMVPAMALALDASFGSVARWRSEFAALAREEARSGNVTLTFLAREGRLVNLVAADPAPAWAAEVPLLILERNPEVDASIAAIDWAAVYARYQHAVEHASESFAAGHDDVAGALVLDVRRRAMFEQAATRLPGAAWRDPAAVAQWASEIPAGREVVVYCIYGHEVGRATALRLRAAGVPARYLQGGIDGWQSAGRDLEGKEVAP